MINRFIASAAAIVVAAGLSASIAEAGQKQLKFGYPLGNFTAHSNSSHAGKGHNSHYKAKQQAAAKKKALARKRAAHKAKLAKQRQIAAQRKIAARKKQERAAKLAKLRQQRAAEQAAADKSNASPADEVASTTNESVKRAPVKASALAGVNGLLPGSKVIEGNGNNSVVTAKAGQQDVEAAAPAPAKASDENLNCKKYIASAGLTVSVPCGD